MSKNILGIVISNDSRYFILIAQCTLLKIFEIQTGKLIAEKKLESKPCAFSNLGEKIVIGFVDGSIQLFSFSSLIRDFSCEIDYACEPYSPREDSMVIPEEKSGCCAAM